MPKRPWGVQGVGCARRASRGWTSRSMTMLMFSKRACFHACHVGLIELFTESWCLLLWRAGSVPLPASCDCRAREQAQQARQEQALTGAAERDGATDAVAIHSSSRADDEQSSPDRAALPRLTVDTLPPDVLATMDRLTPADRAVYHVAAVRVVRDLLGRRGVTLLCPAALEALVNRTRDTLHFRPRRRVAPAAGGRVASQRIFATSVKETNT